MLAFVRLEVVRDKPDAKATKVATIPYGAKVIVQPNIGIKAPFEVEEIKGFVVKGYWLLVKYGNTEGFVFDGYLSRLPAPIPTEQDLAMETYLNVQVGKVGKKYDIQIYDKATNKYRMATQNEKIDEKEISKDISKNINTILSTILVTAMVVII